MEFKIRLKELRYEKNMTQDELAKFLSLSVPTISAYESGRRSPDQDTLKKLANLFNVSVDYLIGQTDIKAKRAETTKTADLNDENTIMTFDGKPIPEEDMEIIKRLLRGRE